MGTPKRLEEVKRDLSKNIVRKKNYKNLQKALFLDRDNTIINCKEGDYITQIDKINFICNNIEKILPISLKYDLVLFSNKSTKHSDGKTKLGRVRGNK